MSLPHHMAFLSHFSAFINSQSFLSLQTQPKNPSFFTSPFNSICFRPIFRRNFWLWLSFSTSTPPSPPPTTLPWSHPFPATTAPFVNPPAAHRRTSHCHSRRHRRRRLQSQSHCRFQLLLRTALPPLSSAVSFFRRRRRKRRRWMVIYIHRFIMSRLLRFWKLGWPLFWPLFLGWPPLSEAFGKLFVQGFC